MEQILNNNQKLESLKAKKQALKTSESIIKNCLSLIIIVIALLAVILLKVVVVGSGGTETVSIFDYFVDGFSNAKEEMQPLIDSYAGQSDYVANIKISYYVPLIFCIVFFSISVLSLVFLLCFSVFKLTSSIATGECNDISSLAFYAVGAYLLSLFAILGDCTVNLKSVSGTNVVDINAKLENSSIALCIVITVITACLFLFKQFLKGKEGWQDKNLVRFIFSTFAFAFCLVISILLSLTFTSGNISNYGVIIDFDFSLNSFISWFTSDNYYDGSIKQTFWQSMMNADIAYIFNYVTILIAVIAIVRYLIVLCGGRKAIFDYVISFTLFVMTTLYFIIGIIAINKMTDYFSCLGVEATLECVALIILLCVAIFNAIFNVMELIVLKKSKLEQTTQVK